LLLQITHPYIAATSWKMSRSPLLYSYYVRVEEHADAMRMHIRKNALS